MKFEELPKSQGPPDEVRVVGGIGEVRAPATVQEDLEMDVSREPSPETPEPEYEATEPGDAPMLSDGEGEDGGVGNDAMDTAMLHPDDLSAEDMELFELAHDESKEEVCKLERHIMQIIRDVGGSRKAYKASRRAEMKAILTEVYSPPRVTAAAKLLPKYGVAPGMALDLTTVDEDGKA